MRIFLFNRFCFILNKKYKREDDFDFEEERMFDASLFPGRRGERKKSRAKKKKGGEREGESLILNDLQQNTLPIIESVELPNQENEGDLASKDGTILEKKSSETNLPEKNPDFVYYPEIAKHLIDATKDYNKKDDRRIFEEAKRLALDELKKRIPNVEDKIRLYKLQIYWAAKVMGGYKEKTPFGDPQRALDFLRQNWD